MLADPTDSELATLKAFTYTPNETVLHTDPAMLPRATRARASWNYLMTSCTSLDAAPVVTYWMNRLQGHSSAQEHLVTLNARERIDASSIIAVMDYEHPLYTAESVAAQRGLAALATETHGLRGRLPRLGFPRGRLPLRRRGGTALRGRVVSGAAAVPAVRPAGTQALPALPALVLGDVRHQRPGPVRHGFSHRVYQWLVDLDDLPDPPWYLRPFASFRAADHLGRAGAHHQGERRALPRPPRHTARGGGPCAHAGERPGPRPRLRPADGVLVLWRRRRPRLRRRRGAQHVCRAARATCCAPTPRVGRAPRRSSTSRRSTTSPAGTRCASSCGPTVSGPRSPSCATGARASPPPSAGDPVAATSRAVARQVLSHPLMPQRVSALIRLHGIWLWLRRLPLARRPHHRTQEGV